MALFAYPGGQEAKNAILSQLALHRSADELIKGKYWEDGKGCAIGCTLHSGDHAEYEPRFGIPQMLAQLEDCIFEGLPNGAAKKWPERFMSAFVPGREYALVGWQFLHWILTDHTVNPGIDDPLVRDAVRQCANVIAPLANGLPIDKSAAETAERAARRAARSTENVAERAAWIAARAVGNAASAENVA